LKSYLKKKYLKKKYLKKKYLKEKYLEKKWLLQLITHLRKRYTKLYRFIVRFSKRWEVVSLS